jgi:hypothetical protein
MGNDRRDDGEVKAMQNVPFQTNLKLKHVEL